MTKKKAWRKDKRKKREKKRFATGADIPDELLCCILKELLPPWRSPLWGTSEPSMVDKNLYATLSLVCKYWARMLRQPLFDILHLRSAADVLTLAGFVRHPTSVVSDCLRDLQMVVTSASSSPFLHLAHRIPSQRVCLCGGSIDHESTVHITARYHASGASQNRLLTSLHAHLPRTVPASFSRGICTLSLRSITFRSFGDFARVVLELPTLHSLYAAHLKWRDSTVEVPRWRLRKAAFLKDVQLEYCTAYTPVIRLLADGDETIVEIAYAAEQLLGASVQHMYIPPLSVQQHGSFRVELKSIRNVRGRQEKIPCCNLSFEFRSPTAPTTPNVGARALASGYKPLPDPKNLTPSRVALFIHHTTAYINLLHAPWGKVDRALSDSRHLREVSVAVDFDATAHGIPNDLEARFQEDVRSRLPKLAAQKGKLRVVLCELPINLRRRAASRTNKAGEQKTVLVLNDGAYRRGR